MSRTRGKVSLFYCIQIVYARTLYHLLVRCLAWKASSDHSLRASEKAELNDSRVESFARVLSDSALALLRAPASILSKSFYPFRFIPS